MEPLTPAWIVASYVAGLFIGLCLVPLWLRL